MSVSRNQINKKNNHISSILLTFLVLLALFSSVGLDYINWKKGNKSYIFFTFSDKNKKATKKESFSEIILNKLLKLKIPADAINQYRDTAGIRHIMINIPFNKYLPLASTLEEDIHSINAFIQKKEELQSREKNYYLWHVKGKGEQLVSILFSCQKEKAQNKVAIIMDDMGFSLEAIEEICSIKKPITISILPFSPFLKETARIAHQNNLEVMLHLPLESINNDYDNNHTKGIIHSRMSKEEIIETMEECLSQVPYIKGINNHMGSKITPNKFFMNVILRQLKKRNLYFIDSRTTSLSVAYDIAHQLQIPSAYRHVFLDAKVNENYIKEKLLELFRFAQKNGKAVGICHPNQKTLNVLKTNIHLVENYNLEPVFASQIVR